ncbi:hypothetical protein [Glycomyces tenuis]|uniref:hypothetical protein n=1 Tax=Glycomyces tenuis TaxID=58116 RepID=UPI0012DF37A4|nr:hypothetical protein [Glycomyces tenuis]
MRRLLLVAGAVSALMPAAACGEDAAEDDSVASVDGGATQSETAEEEEVSREEALQNYVECMRDNGVEAMPDPSPNGGMQLTPEVGEDPEFEAAQEACQEELPDGGPGGGGGPDPELVLEFVECMRDNGVEDMPDPQSGGGIMMGPETAEDPDFEAAMAACEDVLQELRG